MAEINMKYTSVDLDNIPEGNIFLLTLLVDASASTNSSTEDIQRAVHGVLTELQTVPEHERIVVRLVIFGTTQKEIFGFVPIKHLTPPHRFYTTMGSSALIDACCVSLETHADFIDKLGDRKVASAVVAITDGEDDDSRIGNNQLRSLLNANEQEFKSFELCMVWLNSKIERYEAVQTQLQEIIDFGSVYKFNKYNSPSELNKHVAGIVVRGLRRLSVEKTEDF